MGILKNGFFLKDKWLARTNQCASGHLQQEREGMRMSIVIIGGHDRMVRQYHDICKAHKCKAKVFTQMTGDLKKQVGRPDLFVLFTNTVSHKMVKCALEEAKKNNIEVVRCHASSQAALEEILGSYC